MLDIINIRFKHCLYQNNFIVIPVALAVSILAVFFSSDKANYWNFLIPIIGGWVSFFYFVQQQQIEELRLFKEMFTEFNKRYDGLNEKLNEIIKKKATESLNPREIDTLYNYFNLCGEEYLIYKKGYIYPEVWEAWFNGMMIFYGNPRIHSLWLRELETGSYYGLRLKEK